jgi:hypothetical protein
LSQIIVFDLNIAFLGDINKMFGNDLELFIVGVLTMKIGVFDSISAIFQKMVVTLSLSTRYRIVGVHCCWGF